MNVQEALLARRSIRKFKDTIVPEALIEELMHAAMSAPSAGNQQIWEFFVVTNEEILERLRKVHIYTKMETKLAIVVCGNLARSKSRLMESFWAQDCSAATENILLRAVELGLGAVWCGIHPQRKNEEKVQAALGLEETLIPLNILFIGYPNETKDARDQYNKAYVHYLK